MTTTPASSRFVNIGERTNVTGSARFKKLVMAGDYPAAVAWQNASGQARQGDVSQASG